MNPIELNNHCNLTGVPIFSLYLLSDNSQEQFIGSKFANETQEINFTPDVNQVGRKQFKYSVMNADYISNGDIYNVIICRKPSIPNKISPKDNETSAATHGLSIVFDPPSDFGYPCYEVLFFPFPFVEK